VEIVKNAVVSTNTKDVALKVVALLAFLDRIVMLVGTGVVQNGVVLVVVCLVLGVGVVTGTGRDVDVVGVEVLSVVVATAVCWDNQSRSATLLGKEKGRAVSQSAL
jgi:hypothetical protein